MTKRHQGRQHGRRTRGAALLEAVVLLPVLLLLLLGVSLVAQRIHLQQAALAEARDCAHRFSRSGCSAVPEGCEGRVSKRGATSSDAFDEEAGPVGQALRAVTGPLRALSAVPFVREGLDALLGSEASSVADLRAAPVTLFRREERVVVGRGALVLPCNEVPTSDGLGDVVWDAITGELF